MNTELTASQLAKANFQRNGAIVDPDLSIGSILINFGRLTATDAEKIIRYQVERNLRFGEAGTALGLLTNADIEFALSRQFEYPYLLRGESPISEALIAAYDPFSGRVEALRALRNQLMWRWFETGPLRRALAVTSAEHGEGRSLMAANLAIVFSQQGQRTLLIDADMRNPQQHSLFALENRSGLSSILSSRNSDHAIQPVVSLRDLSVLTAGPVPPNPLELLGRPIFESMLRQLALEFDVILIDTPPGSEFADAQTVAARTGAAIILARQDKSRLRKVRDLADMLAEARVHVVGTVMSQY
ncbi:MAG: chain length determinant protein tyrosine kinase EpsG [Pseudomonadota bacterium]